MHEADGGIHSSDASQFLRYPTHTQKQNKKQTTTTTHNNKKTTPYSSTLWKRKGQVIHNRTSESAGWPTIKSTFLLRQGNKPQQKADANVQQRKILTLKNGYGSPAEQTPGSRPKSRRYMQDQGDKTCLHRSHKSILGTALEIPSDVGHPLPPQQTRLRQRWLKE